MHECRTCHQLFEPTPLQRAWLCKPCRRIVDRKWRADRKAEGNPVRSTKMPLEYHQAYNARYNADPENLKRSAALQRIYAKDPLKRPKYAARWLVHRAIISGRLVRGACSACGSTALTDGHHDDYTKPLVVMWLCPPCHRAHHYNKKAGVQ